MLIQRTPYLSPRGFIQYPVNGFTIIKVYDDSLPAGEASGAPIHDHVDDFTARVVKGKLTHIAYDFSPNPQGEYRLFGTQPWLDGEDTVMKPLSGMTGDIAIFETLDLPAGYQFQFRAGWFHEVKHSGLTVVVMVETKRNVTASARVVGPLDVALDIPTESTYLADEFLPLLDEALTFVDRETLYAS